MFVDNLNATKMRVAIEGVEKTIQPIFSLIAELELQGYAADAAALQVTLDALKAQIPVIKTNVAS